MPIAYGANIHEKDSDGDKASILASTYSHDRTTALIRDVSKQFLQASDISEGLKEEQESLKKATDEDFADPLLQSALGAAFAQYILDNPTCDLKSDEKTTYIYGLLAMWQ